MSYWAALKFSVVFATKSASDGLVRALRRKVDCHIHNVHQMSAQRAPS